MQYKMNSNYPGNQMVNNHQMQYFYNYTAQNSSYNFNNSFY